MFQVKEKDKNPEKDTKQKQAIDQIQNSNCGYQNAQ